jgi:hypothetical protein
MWDKSLRSSGLTRRAAPLPVVASLSIRPGYPRFYRYFATLFLVLLAAEIPSYGREKHEKDALQYGAGLIVNIPLPEAEVEQAVEDVAQNTIIRGTKEYNTDEYVKGAIAAISTPVFPAWKEGGKVFYKVRKQALDPRNFKDGGDLGTLAVRYVVQPQGEKNTILRIDAAFQEDFRHIIHQSNGSVEGSEYKDIHDRLDQTELMQRETAEALREKEERAPKQSTSAAAETVTFGTPTETAMASGSMASSRDDVAGALESRPQQQALAASASPSAPASIEAYASSGMTLEQRVTELRRELERVVKKPGAPLQSAPFHTATTLKSLEPGTEVLIVISTPYWYGVETRDGQHGWVKRDQLELMP